MAKAAGVATSTVSKALREDPTIPEARRRAIQETAHALGYRPNPLVSALMARLHSRRRRSDPHHLAWIDLWPDDEEAAARATDLKLMFKGASQRAEELGYRLEVHRAGRDRTTATRLHQILISRSQWGVIIPPVPLKAMSYPLSLEGLTGVTIGTSLHQPLMHRVAPNLFQGGQLACRKLREKGYGRIGLVLSPAINERTESKWLGAFLAEQLQWATSERLAPLLLAESARAQFQAWLERFRPDVILIAEPHIEKVLRTGSRGAAGKAAIAWLRMLPQMPRGSMAIDTGPAKMGAAAVELVVGQIHRNERGSPQFPHALLLDGVWCE